MSPQIKIDPNTLEDWPCPKCESTDFTFLSKVKKLSRFQSPDGTPGITIVQHGLACTGCGEFYSLQDIMKHRIMEESDEQKKLVILGGGN